MGTDVIVRLTGTALVQAGQQAKAHIDAAERHSGKAEEQYKAAGAYLVKAKSSVKHGQWLPWLKKYGIAQQTASLCMRIYEDPEVLTQERERVKEAVRKHREAKAPLRNGDLTSKQPTLPDPVQEEEGAEPVTRKRKADKETEDRNRAEFLLRADGAARLAGFGCDSKKVTQGHVDAAQRVVDAWSALRDQLNTRKDK